MEIGSLDDSNRQKRSPVSKAYVEKVNSALEEMKTDGTYHRILEAFGYSDVH